VLYVHDSGECQAIEDRAHAPWIQARLACNGRPAEPGVSGGQHTKHANISLSAEQLVERRSQRIL
jgi:hypothetical protein